MTSTITAAEALEVVRQFAIRTPVVHGRIETGFMNGNWLVEDGGTGRRYTLRKYRLRNSARIEFQLAFQGHLHAAGFPTAVIVKTLDRASVSSSAGSFWSLSSFVEGEVYDFSRLAQAREAGSRLAEFHAVSEEFAGPAVDPPAPDIAYIGSPLPCYAWRGSTLTGEFERRLLALYPEPQYKDDLALFSAWRRAAAKDWTPERLAALPQSWLHCDYHGRNMLFRHDTLVGLFDFDFLSLGPRVYDVGRGVFNFGREYRGSTKLREEFCRAFLEGFEVQTALTDEERRSLTFMAALNWAPDVAIDGRTAAESRLDQTPSRLQSAVRLMLAVDSEMRRLAPLFSWDDS